VQARHAKKTSPQIIPHGFGDFWKQASLTLEGKNVV
jgi:hypothetical protein